MGFVTRLKGWLRGDRGEATPGLGVDELARRLRLPAAQLESHQPVYRSFAIAKQSGGMRTILAPDDTLRGLQRLLLRRVFARLRCHPAALGFERGQSIVTHARLHARRAVVLRMDLKDFFSSTRAERVTSYLRKAGWNAAASELLARLCTHAGSLPTGAPTSPRLSNLVNYRLDARLSGLAARHQATYSRYADDLTFSFAQDARDAIHAVIGMTKVIVADDGYQLHQKKKLRIARQHERQVVTGLVVNGAVNLPRSKRRWLRAVEHRLATGRGATLTRTELDGWRALRSMIEKQRDA
ncbi:MAG: reverse transcriptase family protein [Planctomycetota bacterium]